MTKWYDSDNPSTVVRGATWRMVVWVIVITLIAALVSIGVWFFKVQTSDIKGAGDATRTKNSSTNRIAAQERFEELYADIIATDRKITPAFEAMKANPDSQVASTNYNGLVNYCLDIVGEYNAAARKYSSEDFRAVDLPAQIDTALPDTDCKESAS